MDYIISLKGASSRSGFESDPFTMHHTAAMKSHEHSVVPHFVFAYKCATMLGDSCLPPVRFWDCCLCFAMYGCHSDRISLEVL